MRFGRQEGVPLGPHLYREVRYESLLADPAGEFAELCAFLGVAYDGAMPRYHEHRPAVAPDLDEDHAWLPPTGGLLDELGYERGAAGLGRGSVRRARELRGRSGRKRAPWGGGSRGNGSSRPTDPALGPGAALRPVAMARLRAAARQASTDRSSSS